MERANSFIGNAKSIGTKDGAVAIVDPFSTGAHLALAITRAGYKCVRVFSIWDSPVASLVQEGITVEFCATLQHNDQEANQDAATDAVSAQYIMEIIGRVIYCCVDCEAVAGAAFPHSGGDPGGGDRGGASGQTLQSTEAPQQRGGGVLRPQEQVCYGGSSPGRRYEPY